MADKKATATTSNGPPCAPNGKLRNRPRSAAGSSASPQALSSSRW
ncbi:hypothetical protein HMPREF9598_00199 [Cutibacterium acnes HL050PA1]|nr:hypothetical protein HMPREF9598_00199 [Cutibacterium acnes HL050PA1]